METEKVESWMRNSLETIQNSVEQLLPFVQSIEREASIKQKKKILDLNISLNAVRSNLYFCIRDIKDIQQLRKEEKENER